MLSLRVSRDKRGYDYIYLLLEARRRGRVENRLLYCGRWPAPCRVGVHPFDDETRTRLERAHPDVPFDWPALLKTLHAALGVARPPVVGPPLPPPSRSRRPGPPGGAPPGSGRPGAPFRSPGAPPSASHRERDREREQEHEPLRAEVVLVSAELEEERDESFAGPDHEHEREREREPQPEFEPVCESDRPFTAAIDLELMTEEIVHVHVTEPAAAARGSAGAEAIPVEGHVFTEASGPATFDAAQGPHDADAEADDEEDADADADTDADTDAGADAEASGTSAKPGAVAGPGAAGTDEQARRRRRRRRGGRGRGKPPDSRHSSE